VAIGDGAFGSSKKDGASTAAGIRCNRRKRLRIARSTTPKRWAMARLLSPHALRRNIVRSRGLGRLGVTADGRPRGRPSARTPLAASRS
jgi:hypothetical protein